jgi:hypothetical protein
VLVFVAQELEFVNFIDNVTQCIAAALLAIRLRKFLRDWVFKPNLNNAA